MTREQIIKYYEEFLTKSGFNNSQEKKEHYINRLSKIYKIIQKYNFINQFSNKILEKSFQKIANLCKNDQYETFDKTDESINSELTKIENNLIVLSQIEENNCQELKKIIMANSLDNAYQLCKNIIINNNRLIDLLSQGNVNNINWQQIKNEEISQLMATAKKNILNTIEKYLKENLPEHHLMFYSPTKSIHTKVSSGSFSVELTLKLLYVLVNLDDLINKHYPNLLENTPPKDIVDNYFDPLWFSINRLPKGTIDLSNDKLKKFKMHVSSNFAPKAINGHTLFAILDKLPNDIKNFIKYKIMITNAVLETRLINFTDEYVYVTAQDILLLLRDFDPQLLIEQNKKINNDLIINSNNFDGQRYSLEQLKDDNLRFIFSLSIASYITLTHEFNRKMNGFSQIKTSKEYEYFKEQDSQELHELIKNPEKRVVLTRLCQELPESIKQKLHTYLDKVSFYELVKNFSYEEIYNMFESISSLDQETEREEFKDLLYYSVFLKTYIKKVSINLDSPKFARVNKLFEQLRKNDDFTQLGNQFTAWFYSIPMESLSDEEFEIINLIDPKYVQNSLDYMNKIIYQKCLQKGIKFSYQYRFYHSQLEEILNKYSEMFKGGLIPIEFITLYSELQQPFTYNDYQDIMKILNELNLDLKDFFCMYVNKIGVKHIKRIPDLARKLDLKPFEIVDLYNQNISLEQLELVPNLLNQTELTKEELIRLAEVGLLKDNLEEVINVSKSSGLNIYTIADLYEREIELNKINEILSLSKESAIPLFAILELLELNVTPDQLTKIPQLMQQTGLSIQNIIYLCWKRMTLDEIAKINDVAQRTNLSVSQIIEFHGFGNFSEHIDELSKTVQETGLPIFQIGLYYEFGVPLDKINEMLTLSKQIDLSKDEISDLYKAGLTAKEIKKVPSILKKVDLSVYDIGQLCSIGIPIDDLEKITAFYKTNGLKFYEFHYLYKEKLTLNEIKEFAAMLNNLQAKPEMLINNLEELITIYKLIGSVGEYLFYKKSHEVKQYIELCQEKNISFNPEWLYKSDDEIRTEISRAELSHKIDELVEKGLTSDEIINIIYPHLINQSSKNKNK